MTFNRGIKPSSAKTLDPSGHSGESVGGNLIENRDRCEPLLLALQAAMDADTLWDALRNLLDAAFPNHSIIAALRVGGDSPPVFYHTHRESRHTHQWFTETLNAHPCFAHLMAHPGTPVLRLGQVLPAANIPTTPSIDSS